MSRVTIAPVAEGHGEVKALPLLLRRIAFDLGVYALEVHSPNRVGRSTLATEAGIVAAVDQASYRVPERGGVLVVFDADDDCPVELASRLLAPARRARQDKSIGLVLAVREFEAHIPWRCRSRTNPAAQLWCDIRTPGDGRQTTMAETSARRPFLTTQNGPALGRR